MRQATNRQKARYGALAAILLLLATTAHGFEFSGQCVRILDGDTIDVLYQGKPQRIRLAEVDTPETGKGKKGSQPFGQAATRYVRKVCGGETVSVKVVDRDRYRRLIAHVYLPDGRSLNRDLVQNGLAWWYRQYSKDASLGVLEAEARAARRGLWADPNPIPPWEWRRNGQ